MTVLPALSTVLIVLCGAVVGGGVILLVAALTARAPVSQEPSGPPFGALVARMGRRGVIAVGVGLAVLLVTRWPVAAIAGGVLAVTWPLLFGGARAERTAMARLEGLAAWTESLRDTIAGAVGLEQAIPATAYAAAPSVSPQLLALSDRLRVRTPLPAALQRFADDIADPTADLIVAALVLNARLRGPGLRQVLSSLAESTREDLDMRRRIAASRASTRRSVQIVVGVTVLFVGGMCLFNRTYVAPFNSVTGQFVLLIVVLLFAAGFTWMRRLATFDVPARFLQLDADALRSRS
jgi:Flp pilus assembly protein TadB